MLAPFDQGGPGTVAHYILKEFTKMKNIEISLVVNDSASEKEIIEIFGNRFNNIIRIANDRSNFEYFKLMTKGAKETWKIINDNDIIHINSIWTLRGFYIPPFASLLRKPLLYTWHGLSEKHYFGENNQSIKKIAHSADFALTNSLWSRVIVNSGFMQKYVSQFYDANRIRLIPNGVKINEIRNAKKTSLEGEISLLFVGKLIPIKGLDLLLEAFSILKRSTTKDVRLYIAGTGSHESEYRSLASRLNIEKWVNFLGQVPLSECYSLFKSCSIYVIPSRFESASMALLEGMAAGAPIVATDTGGNGEIAKSMRNCLLTKIEPQDIAEKITFLIDSPNERKTFSENNIKDSESYSWENIASSHVDLYNSLI
jgi:glycosyltransferase involved in cell wall biosynthesis